MIPKHVYTSTNIKSEVRERTYQAQAGQSGKRKEGRKNEKEEKGQKWGPGGQIIQKMTYVVWFGSHWSCSSRSRMFLIGVDTTTFTSSSAAALGGIDVAKGCAFQGWRQVPQSPSHQWSRRLRPSRSRSPTVFLSLSSLAVLVLCALCALRRAVSATLQVVVIIGKHF